MALDRILSVVLRLGELAFAAIVAGVTGHFLHQSHAGSWSLGRLIYAEVVAALSLFFALIWLVPFSATFVHWPIDLILSLCWWAVFGLLVDFLGNSCGSVFHWGNVSPLGGFCGKFKADIAFSFLSALFWLVSALLGIFWLKRRESHASHHGRWHRRSHV
ncbi:hypothetical protein N3K66_004282 [Trichothecium roseum]|uniref:Uncharacterized protein n=1 Tax=Trichothecium roseum TaxID=47278 RepID=A0ACC0V278_9HYPO|nr:hypothetical protein N3K66_004282 [Trichothecium roseum]